MSKKEIKKAEKGFVDKMKKFAGNVPFAREAVEIYYCMIDPNTPATIKALCATPLVYFISPFDAVPDVVPVAGLADDASVVLAAYKILKNHITDEHTQKMKDFLLIEEKNVVEEQKFKNPEAVLSVVSYLAHIDGSLDSKELKFIEGSINSESEDIEVDRFKEILERPPTFESLTRKLKAAKEDYDSIKELISGIINADHEITFNEEVAALKISLFIEGAGDVKLYKIDESLSSEDDQPINEILNHLALEEAKANYTFTKKVDTDAIYLAHPDDNSLLVTPEYLFTCSVKDKVAETLSAMGRIGAKKVIIKKSLYNKNQSNTNVSGSIDLPAAEVLPISGDISMEATASSIFSSQEEQEYEIEFEKPKKGFLDNIFSKRNSDEMDFLSKTSYLKNDPLLTNLFKDRLSPQKPIRFAYSISEEKSSELQRSFQSAVKVTGQDSFSIGSSVNFDKESSESNCFKYDFEVEFHPS